MYDDSIKVGDFVIVQRQSYTKLHKMKQHGTITLGKDVIELDEILGHRFYETFRMVGKLGSKRMYMLEEVTELTTTNQLATEQSGHDNRNIVDDGSSQTLTKAQIEELREQALSSSDIVEKLIANSKTFSSKTEFSQEKYVKKKEKKYFEYIQIRKPSLRLLAQMFYRQDPAKTLGIRIDDLSQILTYSNVQADGNFLLYDSGTSGLVTAAILNSIGANTTGRLIHAHPGNECQKNAVLAMQFPQEQLDRCIHVNLYSVLRCYYQNKESYTDVCLRESKQEEGSTRVSTEKNNDLIDVDVEKVSTETNEKLEAKINEDQTTNDNLTVTNLGSSLRKRKLDNIDLLETPAKKPCWQIDNEKACRILQEKVDSLIIVAKEHPVNIVKELVQFLKAGRTVVVFSLIKEPLQELYFYLKNRTDFIAVKLSNNFMRNYQILPERTHPEVIMNSGGYILSGYKLNV